MPNTFLLGSWVRAGTLTGLVVDTDGENVSVFDPGERRLVTVAGNDVQTLPAAAVRVTMTVDLPLPHGVGEESLRRWLAALIDPVLRDRASAALRDTGKDPGPALPMVDVVLTPSPGSEAVCLCGKRTALGAGVGVGADVACSVCGRMAVPPP